LLNDYPISIGKLLTSQTINKLFLGGYNHTTDLLRPQPHWDMRRNSWLGKLGVLVTPT